MKLLTKEIEEKFKKYPIGSQEGKGLNAKVLVKFFNPAGAGTWFILEAEKMDDGDYEMYGYCHLGYDDLAEFGYVMLSELQEFKGTFGLGIERDKFLGDVTLEEAFKKTGIEIPAWLREDDEDDVG